MCFVLCCVELFIAGPIVSQPQEVLPGYPAVLSCGRDPVEPVRWTFQASPHSVVKDVKSSERFGVHGSSVVLDSVKEGDSGLYNCTDADGALHHTIQLSLLGKPHTVTPRCNSFS